MFSVTQAARRTNDQFVFKWVSGYISSRKYSTNGTAQNTFSLSCEPMTTTSIFSGIGPPFLKENGISFPSERRGQHNGTPPGSLAKSPRHQEEPSTMISRS